MIRAPVRATGFAISTLLRLGAVTAHQSVVPEPDRDRVFDRHMRAWCRALLRRFRLATSIRPEVPGPATGARLVVANHRSPADIIVLLRYFGGQFLGRADVANWPILGPAARRAGTIWVERGQGGSGALAIRAMRRRLKDGATLLVFPEGTTYAGDRVHPFHLGALSAARNLDVEIIPVGLAYDPGLEWVDESFLRYLTRMGGLRSARVSIRVGEPTRPGRDESTAALAHRLRTSIQTLVHQARSDHDAS
jgi:1-acyl-sn-glycerol-3-phosphate acyltransferase